MVTISSLAARISALFSPRVGAREELEAVPVSVERRAPADEEFEISAANNDTDMLESMRVVQAATTHHDI